MRLFLALLLAFAIPRPAPAQEVSAALGRLHGIGEKGSTYSWQIQYLQHFSPYWAGSLTWLNEGHLPNHHRDGAVIQAWRFHQMEQNDLRLSIGLGIYRAFDTTTEGGGDEFYNRHSVKPLLSLMAQYPAPSGTWEAFAQLNRTLGGSGPQTQSIMVGASTRFGTPALPPPSQSGEGPLDGVAE